MIDSLLEILRARYNHAPVVRGHMPVLEKSSKTRKPVAKAEEDKELRHAGPVLARLEQMSQRF